MARDRGFTRSADCELNHVFRKWWTHAFLLGGVVSQERDSEPDAVRSYASGPAGPAGDENLSRTLEGVVGCAYMRSLA